jgi:hypothetical protein
MSKETFEQIPTTNKKLFAQPEPKPDKQIHFFLILNPDDS